MLLKYYVYSVQWSRVFEWDEKKSQSNLEQRGFDFEFATRIFDGDLLETEDTRRTY